MILRKLMAVLCIAALALLGLSSCTLPPRKAAPSPTAEAPRSFTVFNSSASPLAKEWAAAFEELSGISTTVITGTDAQLQESLGEENAKPGFDVVISDNPGTIASLDGGDQLAVLPPTLLKKYPQTLRSYNGTSVAVAARANILVYNKDRVPLSGVPRTADELASAALKGRWTTALHGSALQDLSATQVQLRDERAGKTWLTGVKGTANWAADDLAAMTSVNTGDMDLALVPQAAYFADRARTGEHSSNLGVAYFEARDPGAVLVPTMAAALDSGPFAKDALRFMDFISGAAGQKLLASGESYRYPTLPGTPAKAGLKAAGQIQQPELEPLSLDLERAAQLYLKVDLG